ncbi:hypothetical protein DACRYDRAFT_91891 [Dacryopinax primogenitus]|uniref:Uncharacterized protein n=1 Tax=Dacryopinax primogenitus (strain DJM 731) TaxID=1858805 RepID=M5FQE9_DACPD|nr:uncharacterized protein DACRYDRAFT_91891 [Dacryopinax primogenitus]EJT96939.1 hypothetical protein DACRYDRAFT_91891 [Dacryopinax primogenitus]
MIIIEDETLLDEKEPLSEDGNLVLPLPVPPGGPQTVNVQLPPMSAWMAKHLRRYRTWRVFRNVGSMLAVVVATTIVVFLAIHLAQYKIVPAISPPRKYSWDYRPHGRKRYEYPLGMGPPPATDPPDLSHIPPPRIPPAEDGLGINWGSPTLCNSSEAIFTVDNPLRYALNDTEILSIQVLGPVNGTVRVEVADGLMPEVALAVDGAADGLNACLLDNEGPHQGLGIWTQPYTLSKDGTGLVKPKNFTESSLGGELQITHTVDIVMRLPQNASVRTLDVWIPYMGFEISHPADAFMFDDVVITAGGNLIMQGLQSQNIWATTGPAPIQGNVSAAATYLASDLGEIWANITVAEPQNGTVPSITLTTCNASINANIVRPLPGMQVKARTSNAPADVSYSF